MTALVITNLDNALIVNGLANDATPVAAALTTANTNFSNCKTLIDAMNVSGNFQDPLFFTLRSAFASTPSSTDHMGIVYNRGSSVDVVQRWNETYDQFQSTPDGTNYYYDITGKGGIKYSSSVYPVYGSPTTLSVPRVGSVTSDGAFFVSKSTSTAVDITTTGLGGMAQSANLTGTVAVTSGSATITGTGTAFLTDFVVGDVITTSGGQIRRITNIGGNTTATAASNFSSNESGVTYKRGGRCLNTWYYIYETTDGTTPGVILSQRNTFASQALADLPSGYTIYSQHRMAVRFDASSNIIPFSVWCGWPNVPMVIYNDAMAYVTSGSVGPTNVLNGGTATSFTDVDLSSYVPPTATRSLIKHGIAYNGANTSLHLKQKGSTHEGFQTLVTAASTVNEGFCMVETDSSQVIQYKQSTASAESDLAVYGYMFSGGYI